ncbi:MAG: hypothetical protein ACI9FR_000026 [Cryomorphaceae bacterium]
MQFIWASITATLILTTLFGSAANGQTPMLEAANDENLNPQPRIVAVGDIHGDFDRFVEVLKSTGIINKKNKWSGATDTLVQVGDSTDRGPDSRKAIDLLRKLKKQAAKAGGRVEVVIGNHEVMNLTGDLRYVHPGEYKAFKDSYSKKRLDAYYKQTVAALKAAAPEAEDFKLGKDHRKQWNARFPLGYVAHRLAWDPSGEYGKWVISNSAVVKVGKAVFVHGGISSKYVDMSLSDLNTRVRTELADPNAFTESAIIDDVDGPFWYRGWATLAETADNEAALDEILQNLGVERMVIAHTPLVNTILPRFGGKVLMVDVGMSAYYGGANAALELVGEKAYALISGQRVELPASQDGVLDYLDKAARLVDNDTKILAYREKLIAERNSLSNFKRSAK